MSSPLTGRRLDVYEVQAPIGAGGMGVVYRALDTNLNRPVAIKFLSDELADISARRRFQREAQMASSLNHPHIVTVLDAGEFEGRQYLVTEFIDGGTLGAWAQAQTRSWRQMVEMLIGVADGLAAAHEAGILHRDIKPANILITGSGYAKLADFGLAKLFESAVSDDAPTRTELTTHVGAVVGTAAYMAPEQALGRRVDARSDIFSFGVLLYELLSGRRPFVGATDLDIQHSIVHRQPEPLPENVPLPLRLIVEKAIEKDPAERFQTMREMVIDLRRVVRQRSDIASGATAVAVPPRTRLWPIATAAGLLVLAIAAGLMLPRFAQPTAPAQLEYTPLTNFADSVVSPALSPDGKFLSFIRSEETFWGFGEVFVKLLPDGEPVQLSRDGERKVGPAVFSPDGSRVAYTVALSDRSWDTWAAPVLGGQPSRLVANATALTWIPTESSPPRVLFAEWTNAPPHMALFTSTERRAELRQIYLPKDRMGMVHRAYMSPDRSSVLLIEMDASGWLPCRVIPFDGSSEGRIVGPSSSNCTDAAWSPDGKWMYFTASVGKGFHIWRQRVPNGELEQVTSGVSEEEGLAFAPDGRSIVTSVGTTQGTLWLHDARGDRQVTTQGYPFSASFSADGKRLYYLSSAKSQYFLSGNSELFAADLESGRVERLLADVAMETYSVSDDGSRVAFTKREDNGIATLWFATLDAASPPRRLSTLDTVNCVFGANDEVFFVAGDSETKLLYRIQQDGSGLRKAVEDPIKLIYDVSPDGKWIAVWAGRAVALYPLEGGAPITVCPACAHRGPMEQPPMVQWSRGGRFMYLHESGVRQTFAIPLAAGEMVPKLPAAGLISPAAASAQVANAKMIPEQRAVGGPDPSTYAYVRVTTHRNIYRISFP